MSSLPGPPPHRFLCESPAGSVWPLQAMLPAAAAARQASPSELGAAVRDPRISTLRARGPMLGRSPATLGSTRSPRPARRSLCRSATRGPLNSGWYPLVVSAWTVKELCRLLHGVSSGVVCVRGRLSTSRQERLMLGISLPSAQDVQISISVTCPRDRTFAWCRMSSSFKPDPLLLTCEGAGVAEAPQPAIPIT